MEAGVILRGDLRRAGSGPAVVLALGKYCRIGPGCIIRPSYKTYKGLEASITYVKLLLTWLCIYNSVFRSANSISLIIATIR